MRATIYNHSTWVNTTETVKLRIALGRLLHSAGFTVLNLTDRHFEPHGYTCLWLLAESHLALHTFPEHNTSYIELSSCIPLPFNKFVAALACMEL